MKIVRIVNLIAFILLLIGGINWLLIGILDFNLVAVITPGMIVLARIIYSLVGVSALWLIFASVWTKHIGFPTSKMDK